MKTQLLASLVVLAGCSNPETTEPPPWHGRDLSEPGWQNITIPGHTILGAHYTLAKGQRIGFDWVVPAQWGIRFEINCHDGQSLRQSNQTLTAADQGVHTAPADGIHSLAWTNQNVADVEVWMNVPRWDATGFAVYDDGHNH